MKNIVGKECSFEIKVTAYNTDRGYEEYTVSKIVDESKHNEKRKLGDDAKSSSSKRM